MGLLRQVAEWLTLVYEKILARHPLVSLLTAGLIFAIAGLLVFELASRGLSDEVPVQGWMRRRYTLLTEHPVAARTAILLGLFSVGVVLAGGVFIWLGRRSAQLQQDRAAEQAVTVPSPAPPPPATTRAAPAPRRAKGPSPSKPAKKKPSLCAYSFPNEESLEVQDVELRFVDPRAVGLVITNRSKTKVADYKYWALLWDLDAPPNLLQQPLPIPVRTGESVRPGECLGPNELMTMQAVLRRVKPGDRVFGYAGIGCADCSRTVLYWLYVVQGASGWYAQAEGAQLKQFGDRLPEIAKNPEPFLAGLAPPAKRIPIQ